MDHVIGTLFSRALRKGLVSWMMITQDERQQLDSRGNCAGGVYCMCGVFLSFFKSQHVFVAGNTYKNLTYVYDNRHNMFDGVKVSECQNKDASQRLVYDLSFGTPEVG